MRNSSIIGLILRTTTILICSVVCDTKAWRLRLRTTHSHALQQLLHDQSLSSSTQINLFNLRGGEVSDDPNGNGSYHSSDPGYNHYHPQQQQQQQQQYCDIPPPPPPPLPEASLHNTENHPSNDEQQQQHNRTGTVLLECHVGAQQNGAFIPPPPPPPPPLPPPPAVMEENINPSAQLKSHTIPQNNKPVELNSGQSSSFVHVVEHDHDHDDNVSFSTAQQQQQQQEVASITAAADFPDQRIPPPPPPPPPPAGENTTDATSGVAFAIASPSRSVENEQVREIMEMEMETEALITSDEDQDEEILQLDDSAADDAINDIAESDVVEITEENESEIEQDDEIETTVVQQQQPRKSMPFLSSLSNIDRNLESDEFDSLLAEIEEYDDGNDDESEEMVSMQITDSSCHSDFTASDDNTDETATGGPKEVSARIDNVHSSTSSTDLEAFENVYFTGTESDELSFEKPIRSVIESDIIESSGSNDSDNECDDDYVFVDVSDNRPEDALVDLMQELEYDGSEEYDDGSDNFDEQRKERADDVNFTNTEGSTLSEVEIMKTCAEKNRAEDLISDSEVDYSDDDVDENENANLNDHYSCFEFEDDSSSSSMDEDELLALNEGSLERPADVEDDFFSDVDEYDSVDEICVAFDYSSDNYEENFDFHQSQDVALGKDEESSNDDELDEYDLRLLEEASMPIKAGSMEYDTDAEFNAYNGDDDFEELPDDCEMNEAESENKEEVISFDLGESAVGDDVTEAAVASLDEHWAAHHGIKSRKQQMYDEEQRKVREEQQKLYAQQAHVQQQHGNVSYEANISRAWGTIPPPPPPEAGTDQINDRTMQINVYSSQSTFIRRENNAAASQFPPSPQAPSGEAGTQMPPQFQKPSMQANNNISGQADEHMPKQMQNRQPILSQEEQWRRPYDLQQQQQRQQPPPPPQ